MKKLIQRLLKALGLAIVLLAIVAFIYTRPSTPPAQQIFINGVVLTMNMQNETAAAVALAGDRIVAVGSNDEVLAHKTSDTLVHDLQGKTLIPGIIDAHGHFPATGATAVMADLSSPPVGDIGNIQQLLARLRELVATKPAGEWIMGLGYDDTLLAEMRHPSREELDSVSTKHPIFLLHVSAHMGVANSLALSNIGYDENSENPPGGVIGRDQNGILNGLLEENARMPAVEKMSQLPPLDLIKTLRKGIHDYISMGVTSAQNGAVDGNLLNVLSWATKLNILPMRVDSWAFYDQIGEAVLSGDIEFKALNSARYRAKTIKIVADGSIQGYTGYLTQPYHVPFKGDEEYRGYPIYPRDELVEIVGRVHKAGYQMAIHGNGDAAIDDILYAFEQAQAAHPVADPRLILIHSQMAREDQLDKMKSLGVTPSFFSAHIYYWGDRHHDIFMGPERASRISPTASALKKSLRFTVHLDAPIVPMTPMLMVWSTVNRETSGGRVLGQDQRISAMQALRAITIDAAWQTFREDELGSIEVGKLADLVVLDGNPLADPQAIKSILADQTYVGGVKVYQRESDH
ncbi:MAG: putative amidohydrolase YtcJ [Halioglobus sp.]